MRIAVNTRFLLPGKLEGLGWYTYEICRRWAAAHPQDEFFFLFDRPYDPRFVFGPNVHPIVVFPPARHPVLWYLWFERRLPGILKAINAEVFFSPDGYLSLRSKVPTVMVVHDLAFRHYPAQVPVAVRAFYAHFTPQYLHRARKIVTVSDFVKKDIEKQYTIPSEKIVVVPNGGREEFKPFNTPEIQSLRDQYAAGKPYFFYLGALHPRKNLPRLIAAYNHFRQLYGTDVKLLIGGRMAWQTSEIFNAWKSSPFQEDILFLGYLPEETLPGVLGAAFALTYVSLFEGFGLPVLEAMFSEVPILASNSASIPEVAGNAAILVNPFDEEAIAHGMWQLWENPVLRGSLIQRGRLQRSLFSWDEAADRIYKVLEEVSSEASSTSSPQKP